MHGCAGAPRGHLPTTPGPGEPSPERVLLCVVLREVQRPRDPGARHSPPG